ncbi:MAG TPA: DUF2341 domain-containing protein, partial [Terracidiphilus sp.]
MRSARSCATLPVPFGAKTADQSSRRRSFILLTILVCSQWFLSLAHGQTVPTITWSTPTPITYGVGLSATQLNATANVAGTFSYSPSAGTILLPGSRTLTATFTPTDTTNYTTASASVSLTVLAIAPAGMITTFAGHDGYGYDGDGGPAVSATMSNVDGVAVDSAGNLYIADLQNSVIRKVSAANGQMSTIAGNGTSGYSGDGGPAINAAISWPRGICLDRSGNIYFADNGNNVIRKIDGSTGVITTVAGDGTGLWGYSGDGGPATSARFSGATDVRVDSAGNLYIADPYNMRVRKVSAATGVITTIAGDGVPGYTGDNGSTTSAELYWPYGVAVDPVGNLYITDMNNSVVRRVDATTGMITTVAGNGTQGYTGDNQSATNAELNNPLGITIDSASNLYISDSGNNVIREVVAGTGTIVTIAGNGTQGWSGDGGPAVNAELFTPWGVSTDSTGNLYIADSGSDRVRVVGSSVSEPATTMPTITWANPAPITYSTGLSGTQLNATANVPGTFTYTPDAGSVLQAGLSSLSVLFTPNDTAHYSPAMATVALTVNQAVPAISWANPAAITYGTPLTTTQLNATASIPGIFDYAPAAGTVLLPGTQTLTTTFTPADTNNYASAALSVSITVSAASGSPVISTFAGNGYEGYSGDGGPAVDSQLLFLSTSKSDASGNVYISDQRGLAIRKVDSRTRNITTVVGNGTAGYSGDGGPAANALINTVSDLIFDSVGNLYLVDASNNRVRKVDTSGIITTIAGNGTAGYSGDGSSATNAALNNPVGVAIDSAGNLYIADFLNNVIREVSAQTGKISTVVGNGTQGFAGDGGLASAAELNQPAFIAFDSANNLYIQDWGNERIREVKASDGTITTVAGNGTVGYSGDGGPATSAALNLDANILLDAANNLYIADSGNNVIRMVSASTGIITTVVGTGVAGFAGDGGPANQAELQQPEGIGLDPAGNLYIGDCLNQRVRVVGSFAPAWGASGVTVSVNPSNATVHAGQQQQFTAIVSGTGNTAVNWSISPGGVGTITSAGLYTAPGTIGSQQTVTVTATSQADPTKSASAILTLLPTVAVSIAPGSATLSSNETLQFTATVSNASDSSVVWTISPAGTGTITGDGVYTAPESIPTQQTVTITATSRADSTKSAFATLTLSTAQCSSSGYRYVRAITIDHTKVPNSDQVDFPVLVSGTFPYLATIANGGGVQSQNGYDIIFTADGSGQNSLDFEIDSYNPVTGAAAFWIRIPSLSHSTDTTIFMRYGNGSVSSSQENKPGVWRNRYLSVYHLGNGASVGVSDSGSAGYTLSGTATAASGKIGGGVVFNGNSAQYLAAESVSAYPSGDSPVTLEAWVKQASGEAFGFGSNCICEGGVRIGLYQDSSTVGLEFENESFTGPIPVDSNWHHVVGVYAGGNLDLNVPADQQLFVDGIPVLNAAGGGTPFFNTTELKIGGIPTVSGCCAFSGSVDEVRISSGVRSADWVATEFNNESSPSTFYSISPENISITPPAATLYAQQAQQFTALELNSCNGAFAWSMPGGAPGTLTSNGLYTAPSTVSYPQTVTITATNQVDPTFNESAIVDLLPSPQSPALILAAATPPPYVTSTSEQFSATLKNADGSPLPGIAVTFTVTGANGNSGTGTTDSNGTATFTYSGSNSGNDTIRASAIVDGSLTQSNALSASWLIPVQSISTTTAVGEFFITDASCTFDVLSTATPVFSQTFPTINFNPPSGAVAGAPSSIDVNTRPFTDVTTDINGNYTGSVIAQGNGYQAGVGPMNAFQAVFKGAFEVKTAGNVTFNFYDDDGFIFGIGNGASRISGVSLNMPSTTPLSNLPVMGAYNDVTLGGPRGNQVVAYFPTPGYYPFELDYQECDGGQLALTMTQGASSQTTIAPVGSLTLSPNSVQPLPVGGQLATPLTVVATDASGNRVPNVDVALMVDGVNGQQLHETTNSSGQASFNYTDAKPGTDSVQAAGFITGMLTFSNTVSIPWTLPGGTATGSGCSGTLCVSIDAATTLILPSSLQLVGAAMDSSLPQGDSIATTWTQVSGPGTVTFANSQQASTTASFTTAGSYVLELSAQDVNASTSAQVTVVVNPAPGTDQGWIASPAYGAKVSGIVPITVANGENLAFGELTVYPANAPNNVTILNSNTTTGTGQQIGTFDTTSLNNGTYWITLQATDTNGNSAYNLVLVTVVGNYKPGRVTSTVTDLVVPAKGLAINIQRTYDSLNAGTSGDFGFGWTLGTTVNLTVNPSGSVTFTLAGQRRTFDLTPQPNGFLPYYVPVFTPEPGMHGTLTQAGSGCADSFDYLVSDGSLWECVGGGLWTPPGYVYTDPSGTAYTMTATGQLQSMVDKNGNRLTITLNGITSSTGLSVSFVRDSSGRITKITDPQGNQYLYGYDDNGNLSTVTYPNTSQSSTYQYDSNHFYLSGTDFRGNQLPSTTYYGPTDGKPLNGRLESVTDALGEKTTYAYDLTSNTTTITYPPDGSGNVGTATMAYDTFGDLLKSTDALGHITTNTYDANRNLLTTSDPLSHTTCYTYDANGNRTSVSYPAQSSESQTNCSPIVSTTAYNQFSEPVQTADELGNIRRFNYDVNFNPLSVTDSAGTLASFAFNNDGTMQSGAIGFDISAAPSRASQFTYDADGNMASRTDGLGRTTSYTYNTLGQKVTMVEPLLSGTSASAAAATYSYDAFGNLIETDAPLGRTTKSVYDGNGNKQYDIDANGHKTSYTYDALNRLTRTDYPDGTYTHKTYDFRGNVVDEWDQSGNQTHHEYDGAGREVKVTRAFGTSDAAQTIYTYYDDGRKESEQDPLGHTTTYFYDLAGNLIQVSGPAGNFTYTYDNTRNRTSSTQPVPTRSTV